MLPPHVVVDEYISQKKLCKTVYISNEPLFVFTAATFFSVGFPPKQGVM